MSSETEQLPFILRSVCSLKNDAWCFVPVDADQITHCSRGFLDIWGLSLPIPDESGSPLSLVNGPIPARLQECGLDPAWMFRVCKSSAQAEVFLDVKHEVASVRRTVVFDDQRFPIGTILTCEVPVNMTVAPAIMERANQTRRKLDVLSPREAEILTLLSAGFTNKAMALQTKISEKTVEKHRAGIMRKLGSRNIAELIRQVTEANIVADSNPEIDQLPGKPLDC